jgi:small nuclear ribonucleoprotein (snRNP)-like protein
VSSPYFSETLKSLIGYSIGIFSNDGTLIKGSLVDVKEDYLILQNDKEEHFYHHLNQIKSISKNAKDIQTNKINHDYLQAEKLHEVLEQCKRSWVTINCHNDQVLTGFLSNVFDDHLILISGEEKVIMQNSYISNIFSGFYEKIDYTATDKANESETSRENETEATDNSSENEASRENETEATDNSNENGASRENETEATDNSNENETSRENETEVTDNSSEDGASANNETEASDYSPENKEISNSEIKKKIYVLKRGHEIGKKEESRDDRIEPVHSSSETSEKIEGEMHSFTADSSLRKNRLSKQVFRKKEIKEIDYTLFDRKLRANLTAHKKRVQMLQNEEESKPTAKSKKKIHYDSVDFSYLKDVQFQKCRTNKTLKFSKKDRRLHVEEKQSVIQPTVQVTEEKQDFKQPVLTQEEKERILESQYYSLMKQAEKDYLKLREKRMHRERIK